MQISYSGYYGTQKETKSYDLLDTKGWMEYWQRAQKTSIILRNWAKGSIPTKPSMSCIMIINLGYDPIYDQPCPVWTIADVRLPDYIIQMVHWK